MTKKTTFILALAVALGLLFSFQADQADARTRFISIGTGGTGGVYYPYGGGVAEIWTKHVKALKPLPKLPEHLLKTPSSATKARPCLAKL